MMARREVFKGKDDRLPKLTDDAGMRQYIAVGFVCRCFKPGNITSISLTEPDIHEQQAHVTFYIGHSFYRYFSNGD